MGWILKNTHDMPRFKHVSSPWKTKGLFICWKLSICLMPPFNLVLGVKDSKMWFLLSLMVDRGLKLQLCQTLKRVLEFFTLEAAEHEHDLSDLVNHF